MKKILLTTAAIAAISTSAFADMMENTVYLRGDLGGGYFTKYNTDSLVGKIKVKPQFGFGVDVGVGYYIMDNLRAELVYNYPFASKMKGSTNPAQAPGAAVGNTAIQNVYIKHKPTINAIFAKLNGDIVDLGMGKLFLTGGLGWANVKDTVDVKRTVLTTTAVAVPPAGPTAGSSVQTETYKHKQKNNLAWLIGAGGSFDVAENVHLDIAYSYRDYGKPKSVKGIITGTNYGGAHFTSHNVTVGARFDI